ncbi:MAG: hypothetical protein P0Y63_09330 [Klebsiella huaxiensis]|nr:hypothetical protein [Klebsiella huaxiensis]WEJ91205.1 MAG: hypothetical protein P0Y63_09330 [Klebsiella huaxiensis]
MTIENVIATVPAPDILRCAYMETQVTDLRAAREIYVDILGLTITAEDDQHNTGDPDNPVMSWDVHDNQRRDWWGNPVIASWYTEGSLVLDLDDNPQPVTERSEPSEMAVTIGADGFSYTRKDDVLEGFRLGNSL